MKKWMLVGCICIMVFLFYYTSKTYEFTHLELPSLHSQNALLLNEQGDVLYEKKCGCYYLSCILNKDHDSHRCHRDDR